MSKETKYSVEYERDENRKKRKKFNLVTEL